MVMVMEIFDGQAGAITTASGFDDFIADLPKLVSAADSKEADADEVIRLRRIGDSGLQKQSLITHQV